MSEAPAAPKSPKELSLLSNLVNTQPETLAAGSQDIRLAALQATKYVFDLALRTEAESLRHITSLLSGLSPAEAPRTRSQGKRKRSPSPTHTAPSLQPTPLTSLYVEGLDEDQVWAQLELRHKSLCQTLESVLETGEEEVTDESPKKKRALDDDQLNGGIDMDEVDIDEDAYEDEDGSGDEDETDEESSGSEGDSDKEYSGSDIELGDEVMELRDFSDEDEDAENEMKNTLFAKINAAIGRAEKPKKSGGHPQLDDGFFNLAEFNADTERAEARKVSRGRLSKRNEDDGDDDEDEDIEDIDLFKSVDDPNDPEAALGETEEPLYNDFFVPPARSASSKPKPKTTTPLKQAGRVRFHDEVKVRKIRPRGRGQPVSALTLLRGGLAGDDDEEDDDYGKLDEEGEEMDAQDEAWNGAADEDGFGEMDEDEELGVSDDDEGGDEDDEDIEDEMSEEGDEETIERFRDDLFAEEDGQDDDNANMTNYEKRQAELRAQIAELEAENVAKKDWTLMGEATARTRPKNSLLEEDLEFERVMKAVPVVTEDVVRALEDRIKTRILDGQYDDPVRQRAVDARPFLPSRLFELDDQKSKRSLAQIYEDEFVAAQTGGVAGEDRDGKLAKEHEEVTKLWDSICYKLDSLCNAHFTPKQPKATISTIENVAAASLESALPTSRATRSMLAPEEVFAPSSSDLRARSELTPAEKRAARNRDKKRRRKTLDTLERAATGKAGSTNTNKSVKKQKEEALKSVVKSGRGVTVVGKKSKDLVQKKPKSSR